MPRHLTDVACLEWVRRGRSPTPPPIALAPETTSGVEIHLAGCEACRRKVADFEALERSFHPYGAPMPRPGELRIGRAVLVAGIVLVAGVIAAVVLR